MKVTPTDADPSFYFKSIDDKIIGLLGVYVDDTLAAGNKEFEKETDKIPAEFESKPREFPPILFAGMNIERNSTGGYKLHQKPYLDKIDPLKKDDTYEEFRSTRHKLAWITHTRPEILAGVNILSQVTKDTYAKEHIKTDQHVNQKLKGQPWTTVLNTTV